MNEIAYLHAIVEPLVNNKEDISIVKTIDEMGTLLRLDVAEEDMGLVIGREGATAKAIRALLKQFGAARKSRISIRIGEPINQKKYVSDNLDQEIKDL